MTKWSEHIDEFIIILLQIDHYSDEEKVLI